MNATDSNAARARATLNFYGAARGQQRVALAFVRDCHDPRCELRETPLERLFDRLARPELRAAKDGPGFVPARLREPYRLAEHVEAVTLLAYDIEAHGPADPQPPMPCEIADRCRALRWLACRQQAPAGARRVPGRHAGRGAPTSS